MSFMNKLLSVVLLNSMLMPAFARDGAGGISDNVITDPNYGLGRVEHIVLFKYKPEVNSETKQLVAKNFLALKELAVRNGKPYIVSIVTGSQSSLEGLGHGFEQGFIVTFNSEGDRNYYVGKPAVKDDHYYDHAHNAFKSFVHPYLLEGDDGVLVFDFRVQN